MIELKFIPFVVIQTLPRALALARTTPTRQQLQYHQAVTVTTRRKRLKLHCVNFQLPSKDLLHVLQLHSAALDAEPFLLVDSLDVDEFGTERTQQGQCSFCFVWNRSQYDTVSEMRRDVPSERAILEDFAIAVAASSTRIDRFLGVIENNLSKSSVSIASSQQSDSHPHSIDDGSHPTQHRVPFVLLHPFSVPLFLPILLRFERLAG